MLEALTRIEQEGYQRLAALGARRLATVRTVGGGAASAPWSAMRKQALGVPMLPANPRKPPPARRALRWAAGGQGGERTY